jgi:hypothetical protein
LITRDANGLKVVKLGGLGWAAALQRAGVSEASEPQVSFSAPEARREAGGATVAADLYSVGAVLSWLLGEASGAAVASPAPRRLRALLERAMHREPERRFPSAAEMQLALRAALEEPGAARAVAHG